ncbi:unnamed protein product [Clonostachys rhizophaga]|uniref:Uncharacterized protein n=1 Tax=Clonostachys rhizophaga TaxID=160324 RepID=A0A9N9YJD3_9HYPO|nr:unnamed protein product [Clonostachys rhizophaga]
MEQLQTELEQLIKQSFHFEPISTQRHDQWYKRVYQSSWKDGGCPLILTPKVSREEWTAQVHQFAVNFAKAVHGAINNSSKMRQDALQAEEISTDNKLFQDAVLDEFQTTFTPCSAKENTLTPAMQRLVFWTEPHDNFQPVADAVRALLACEQIGPLLYLARRRGEIPLKDLAPKNAKLWTRRRFKTDNTGWELGLGEALEFLFFVEILKCFPDVLGKEEECERWVPYTYAEETSPMRRYLRNRNGTHSKIISNTDKEIQRCFRIVCLHQMLRDACGLPALNLEEYVINTFLSFLGFEAWNRWREGEGYLGTDLNKMKDEKWLWQNMGDDAKQAAEKQRELDAHDSSSAAPKPPRPRDPLRLREPKAKPVEEPSEEDLAELSKLAALEAEEATYGRKRSAKYHRNQ